MDTSDQYFDSLCRTCMRDLVSAAAYESSGKQQQWQFVCDRIEECGAFRIAELLSNAVPQIAVQLSDELPKKICCKCLELLLSVHRFQQMCLQSEQKMRQQVSTKQTDLSIPAAKLEDEKGTNDTSPYTLAPSSMQESHFEATEQVVKPEATEREDFEHLLESCRDSEGNFSEFVKNEPVEGNEPEMEYSDGDTIQSIISVKDKVMAIESEEQQLNKKKEKTHRIINAKDKLAEYLMTKHKAIHEGVKSKACNVCGKPITKGNLKKHKLTQSDVKAHKCDFCEKRNLHKDRVRNNEDKPYECPYCPQRFKSKPNMYQHKAIHVGLKQEACNICGKSITKRSFKSHLLTHSNEKAHKCDVCGKRYSQIAYLREHMRRHTGEKPYKCKYCERSFSHGSHRIQHMRFHLGKNVHRCELCPLAFPVVSELREHFTAHKNEDPETRERNMKALKEAEAKLLSKEKYTAQPSKEENSLN